MQGGVGEGESGRGGDTGPAGVAANGRAPEAAGGADALPLSRSVVWRLVEPGAEPRRGAHNMAIDHALLESVQAGGRAALRFYYWRPACLSLGRNQPARGLYDPASAAARGIDIVRRPTGGRAVLHDRELTYCVVVPAGELGSPHETYAAINRALVAGLRRLGVPALVVPERAPPVLASAPFSGPAGGSLNAMPCFDLAAPGEVVARGRKLIGSAQRREGRVLLQHGSLLLDGDQSEVVELLARPAPAPPGPPPANLRELLGEPPAREALEEALAEGFEEELGISLAPAALLPAEQEAVERGRVLFESDEWTWRR